MFRQTKKEGQGRRIRSQKGATLVVVVCASAFLAAFALAMIYTAGLLLSNADRRLEQERCYQLAKSFAQALDGELSRFTSLDGADTDSFYYFACRFLENDGYLEYNPDHPETAYHYKADSPADAQDYGQVEIILYKQSDQGADSMAGTIEYTVGQPEDPMEKITGQQISHHTFTVEVVVERKGMQYSYSTSYDPLATYREEAVICKAPDGLPIRWDRATKKWMTSTASEYEIASSLTIDYVIQPGLANVEGYTFRKAIPEIGDP